jgi:hypothetical protein
MTLHQVNERGVIHPDYVSIELQERVLFYQYKDPYYDESEPMEYKFRAYKETPKGYWIVPSYDYYRIQNVVNTRSKRWIRKQYETDRTPRKLFAYQSKDDALYSYYRRKLEHLRHLETKHRHIKKIVKAIELKDGFFGRQRPIVHPVPFYELLHRRGDTGLTPLKKKRITDDFIEESEFAL